ncbi:MAG: acyl-protein synthetase [Rhizobiales bacterium]|nr:acyl-protein synthetase [Hyphomicrobiales bacterium]
MGPQFTLPQAEKDERLLCEMNCLTEHHRLACPGYGRILDGIGWGAGRQAASMSELPWLPVGLFKSHDLLSVPPDEIFRVLTSSGTTNARTSRIFIDRDAAQLQTQALACVMRTLLGPKRLPMLIIDTKSTITGRSQFNARMAGILGMMTFGRDHVFVLGDDMVPDRAAITEFLGRHAGQPIFVFGFTFMIWSHLLLPLRELGLDFSQAILLHGGGWKKLQDQSVDNATYKDGLRDAFGINRVHNFYGMIEQIGSIFLEDGDGWLHAPDFADVLVRDPHTWQEAPPGVPGVIQVMSILPRSYPGHAILTGDLGVWQPEESSAGRWTGKRLRVIGRLQKTELRGCSDTHAFKGAQ